MSVRDGAWPSKYIRRRMARGLEPKAHSGDPSAIFGLFDSGGSRIADGTGQTRRHCRLFGGAVRIACL